jgi:transcriptional regulator with XRE-family HTH domain
MGAKFKSLFTKEYEIFRAQLRKARKSQGLSQEELAVRLNQTQLFISRNELGDRKVDIIELRALCHAMGISFIEFVQQLDEKLNESE